ncbi:MAG: formimidoylglutamase, partial [Gelidibacter sp.]|nr:formimidoylglutamase [Gelidibacter sp.]
MNFNFLSPVSDAVLAHNELLSQQALGKKLKIHSKKNGVPDLDGVKIAILGVLENRNDVNYMGSELQFDSLRATLYGLFPGNWYTAIADLGDILKGETVEDTYFALKETLSILIEKKIIPIILGGSQDLTFANYRAYESLGKVMNILAIDSMFDLGNADQEIHSKGYLNKIILHQPNFLFNYTNVGYQTYLVDPESIKLMDRLYFDTYRIGKVRTNLENVEPLTRNADMITVDISAIKHADAPANPNASPNGFYGEEVCQIMRYAGISDKLSSIGFYELNPSL